MHATHLLQLIGPRPGSSFAGATLATRIALLACCVTLTSCALSPPAPSRAHEVYPSVAFRPGTPPLTAGELDVDGFDFQHQGPLTFLERLTLRPSNVTSFPVLSVTGTHRGWVQESDIATLIGMLDSARPCRVVVKSISSFLPSEPSTVGREAAHLIDGFRAEEDRSGYGGYPPALDSRFASSPSDLREWWQNRQAMDRP